MSRSRRGGHRQTQSEFTSNERVDNTPKVYIIVKYFDPLIDYHFNDRQTQSYSFTNCGVDRDWWESELDAKPFLSCLRKFNPTVGYGIACVPHTPYKYEGPQPGELDKHRR